jgi:hypothetical protein
MSRRLFVYATVTLLSLSGLVIFLPQNSVALDDPGELVNPGFEDGTLPSEMAWTRPFDPVDTTGGLHTSLVLNPFANTPHISYYDSDNGDLKYATLDGGEWTIETIDSTGDVGLYTSIALESRGALRPYIHIS